MFGDGQQWSVAKSLKNFFLSDAAKAEEIKQPAQTERVQGGNEWAK